MHFSGSLDKLLGLLTHDSSSMADSHADVRRDAAAAAASPPAQPHSLCVVVDCLTPLLHRHSLSRVLLFLEALRMHPSVSCVLAGLHTVGLTLLPCSLAQLGCPSRTSASVCI